MTTERALLDLKRGDSTEPLPKDWAERAARGIMWQMHDRRLLQDLPSQTVEVILSEVADVIRAACPPASPRDYKVGDTVRCVKYHEPKYTLDAEYLVLGACDEDGDIELSCDDQSISHCYSARFVEENFQWVRRNP